MAVIAPPISALPLISKELASISPLALNITLSPPDTSKIIWLSVPNLILLSASLPISKLEFTTEVIPVCAALTAIVNRLKSLNLHHQHQYLWLKFGCFLLHQTDRIKIPKLKLHYR